MTKIGFLSFGHHGEVPGSRTPTAADALRQSLFESYAHLLPRALEELPRLLVDGVAADQQGVANHYSFQKFAETWLGMRSRSFSNEAYGLLVPLVCLMNHPAMPGEESNVDVGENTTAGNGGSAHELVELVIVSDGELDVSGGDS